MKPDTVRLVAHIISATFLGLLLIRYGFGALIIGWALTVAGHWSGTADALIWDRQRVESKDT